MRLQRLLAARHYWANPKIYLIIDKSNVTNITLATLSVDQNYINTTSYEIDPDNEADIKVFLNLFYNRQQRPLLFNNTDGEAKYFLVTYYEDYNLDPIKPYDDFYVLAFDYRPQYIYDADDKPINSITHTPNIIMSFIEDDIIPYFKLFFYRPIVSRPVMPIIAFTLLGIVLLIINTKSDSATSISWWPLIFTQILDFNKTQLK